jgi:hypothetical protein
MATWIRAVEAGTSASESTRRRRWSTSQAKEHSRTSRTVHKVHNSTDERPGAIMSIGGLLPRLAVHTASARPGRSPGGYPLSQNHAGSATARRSGLVAARRPVAAVHATGRVVGRPPSPPTERLPIGVWRALWRCSIPATEPPSRQLTRQGCEHDIDTESARGSAECRGAPRRRPPAPHGGGDAPGADIARMPGLPGPGPARGTGTAAHPAHPTPTAARRRTSCWPIRPVAQPGSLSGRA